MSTVHSSGKNRQIEYHINKRSQNWAEFQKKFNFPYPQYLFLSWSWRSTKLKFHQGFRPRSSRILCTAPLVLVSNKSLSPRPVWSQRREGRKSVSDLQQDPRGCRLCCCPWSLKQLLTILQAHATIQQTPYSIQLHKCGILVIYYQLPTWTEPFWLQKTQRSSPIGRMKSYT